MAKDPAFLFYSKDWLQGTSQLMPEEKGVYIDLLAHQHQDGDLPTDTKRLAKMVGISERDFLQVWHVIKIKFEIKDNRMVNRKLTEITTERSTKSLTNKITGTFASIIRLSTIPYEQKQYLKSIFSVTDFMPIVPESITERLTEWFHERLKSIENANINTNTEQVKPDQNGKKFKSSGNFKSQGEELFAFRTSKTGGKPNLSGNADNGSKV